MAGFSARFFFFARKAGSLEATGSVDSGAAPTNSETAGSSVDESVADASIEAGSTATSNSEAPADVSVVETLSRTKRAASASSGSSMVMVTSARPMGGRLAVPLQMQSGMRLARRDLC